jgi:hypothetical protein
MHQSSRLVCIAVLGLVGACSRAEPPAASASALASQLDTRSAKGGAGRPERKLVRSAEIRLEVQTYSEARARVDAEPERSGGYVAGARVEHADGAVAYASLELRIPARELDGFMHEVAGLGTVLHEDLRST